MVDGYGDDCPREGADITAEHMVLPEDDGEASQIVQFFEGSTVFVTGASGYLGKMFMEKLLRVCNLKKLYVLLRPKKGKEVTKRFEELFEGPNMEPLKRLRPNFSQKVELIAGDLQLEDLGMSQEDMEKLVQEVDCVIHCGATVKFDEMLRIATNINVRSVRDLLKMARQMKGLRAFDMLNHGLLLRKLGDVGLSLAPDVCTPDEDSYTLDLKPFNWTYKHRPALLYVSTAFSNCPQNVIDEKFYEAPITGEKLLLLTEALTDDKLNAITPILLGDWPNSYVFTKAVAEDVVRTEGKGLPIAVFRPSIVIASCKEPVAGWIDNIYGATGVFVGAALGLLRTLHGRIENVAEMVPADFVINSAIAALWDIASVKSLQPDKETNKEQREDTEIPVFNYVSSPESPITWRMFMKLSEKHAPQIPSPLLVWHYFFAMHSSRIGHLLAVFFYHTVPAYIVDFIAICIGKKPMLVKGYQKISKFTGVISYFALREWKFSNENVKAVWRRMNRTDREVFDFSMKNFDWDLYFQTYVRGGRVYVLKDPMETLPEGRVRYYKLMTAHYVLMTFLAFLLYKFLLFMYNVVF